MRAFIFGLIASVGLFAGLKRPDATIYQYSTIGAFIEGTTAGEVKVADLMKKGNFGLGYLHDVQGNMVAFNGQFFKIDAKGSPKALKNSDKIALSTMVFFTATKPSKLKKAASLDALKEALTPLIQNQNTPYAVHVFGTFKSVEMFSRQKSKNETLPMETHSYSASKVKGNLIGFWFPSYLSGLCVSNFQFFFLSEDKKVGGFVRDLSFEKGQISLQAASNFDLTFPKSVHFNSSKLNQDFNVAIDEITR